MGAFSSRPPRSTGSDVRDNVLWTLDESVFWESECALIQSILSQAVTLADQQGVGAVGVDVSSTQTWKDIDQLTDCLPFSVKSLHDYCHSVLDDMNLGAGDDWEHRTQPYPLADPAHAHQAQRSFAASATERMQASVAALLSSGLAMTAHDANHSQSGQKDATVVLVEGPIDTLNNTTTDAVPAINIPDAPPTDPLSVSSKWMLQQARVELTAKFLFISALVDKVVSAAAHCYRLQQHVEVQWWKQSRSLTSSMEPRLPARQLQDAEHLQASLTLSLLSFDRAKAAIRWLRRDYELSYAAFRVNELLMWTTDVRDAYLYDLHTLPPSDCLIDSRILHENDEDIRRLTALLSMLRRKALEVEIAVQRNEKSSLDLALDYMDNDGDGRVQPADCSDSDQQLLFPTLAGRQGFITRESMRESILDLCRAIQRSSLKMHELTVAGGAQLTSQEQLKFERALDHFQRDRSRLRRIHQRLHQAFVQHLFVNLGEEVRQTEVHVGRLRAEVVKLHERACAAQDPMDPLDVPNGSLDDAGRVLELVSNTKVFIAPVPFHA
jgi:hypothetical protein